VHLILYSGHGVRLPLLPSTFCVPLWTSVPAMPAVMPAVRIEIREAIVGEASWRVRGEIDVCYVETAVRECQDLSTIPCAQRLGIQ
jgi:hypothetical protein